MTLKILHKNKATDRDIKNYLLFSNENFRVCGLDKISLKSQSNHINKTIASNTHKDKNFLIFNINSNQRVILVKIKNNQSSLDNETKGAELYSFIKSNLIFNLSMLEGNILSTDIKNKNFINEFLHGIELKSYEFNKYKTKEKNDQFEIHLISKKIYFSKINNRFNSLIDGTNLTKDLVSEPEKYFTSR